MTLLPFKLLLLFIGALYFLVAFNDWKRVYPLMLQVFGKKTASKLGTSVSRMVLYLIGGFLILLSLFWIF